MLLQILTYTHRLTTMLFGIFLSAFFLGVKQNKKNVCILLGGGAVSGLFFLICNTVFGSLFTEAVYPIFVHLPLFLLLVFYYRFRWLPSIISIMTAYLCCQFSNWAGIFALSLSGLDWVYYLVRIIVTVAVFAFLSRYLCQTTALLLAKSNRELYILGAMPFVYYVFDYSTTKFSMLLYSGNKVVVEFLAFAMCISYVIFLFVYFQEYELKNSAEQYGQLTNMQLNSLHSEIEQVRSSEHRMKKIAAPGWQSVVNPDSYSRAILDAMAEFYGFDLDTPYGEYPEDVHDLIWYGTGGQRVEVHYTGRHGHGVYNIAFEGLLGNLQKRYRETGSETTKQEYESFMQITPCHVCGGKRLKKESLAVTVGDKNIAEISEYSIIDLKKFMDELTLTDRQKQIGRLVLKEIRSRLGFLVDVGLDYLSLARATATLSGGEAQRIRLATQIGSGLVGVAYILDEPSIGLHQRDNDRLIATLKKLRDLGNTLIVVEHDEDTMREADYIVDIGPGAGKNGGHVVACGTAEDLMKVPESITGAYLSGKKQIPVPAKRRKPTGYLKVKGASENNLKNINVKIPLGVMTCVTGVSGSGKSSLVNEILCKSLTRTLNRARCIPGKHKGIEGVEQLDKVINIDQSPIGRTPRSNPATYTGVFDMIRDLFASTPDAKAKGYKKGRFSFNVKGGRCEACSGDGILKIEMNFLPDIYVPCEVCGGKRYNRETLDVKYKGKSIYDVLDMTVEDALEFFRNIPTIHRKIQTLYDVGLSYVKLGQPSTTLSGGEAQRIKLATELSKRSTGRTIYILDEPTTGLHFADVHKLIEILQRLTEGGNSVVVIEHNLDVIKTADYIVDMGPEGGDRGGTVVTQGTPEQVANCEESYTGYYMKKMLKEN